MRTGTGLCPRWDTRWCWNNDDGDRGSIQQQNQGEIQDDAGIMRTGTGLCSTTKRRWDTSWYWNHEDRDRAVSNNKKKVRYKKILELWGQGQGCVQQQKEGEIQEDTGIMRTGTGLCPATKRRWDARWYWNYEDRDRAVSNNKKKVRYKMMLELWGQGQGCIQQQKEGEIQDDAGTMRYRDYSPTTRWQETIPVKRDKVKNDKMEVEWKKRHRL